MSIDRPRELLWCSKVEVSQQALSKRFLEFPASKPVLNLLTAHQRAIHAC